MNLGVKHITLEPAKGKSREDKDTRSKRRGAMKRLKTTWTILTFLLALTMVLMLPCVGRAAVVMPVAEASASIDWSTFKYYGVDLGFGTPIITFSGESQYVDAWANDNGHDDSASDWTSSLWVDSYDDSAYAEATADSDGLFSYSSVYQSPGSPSAWAASYRTAEFSVQGTGLVVFMVGYEIGTSIAGGPSVSEARASSVLWIQLRDDPDNPNAYSNSQVSVYQSLGKENQKKSGTIAAALFFNNGQTGYLKVGGSSEAYAEVVPIPSSLLLLAPGLLGLIGIRRRRSGKGGDREK